MPKLGLISLGCAKNLVDSEHMLARLRDAGWEKPFWKLLRTSRPAI